MGDRTWYTVTAYRAGPEALQEVDSLLRGLGFQRDQPDTDWWQASEYPAKQGLQITHELRRLADRHRFAFEVCEEAIDFEMGRRYTYLPDLGALHQTTIGNDRNDYLPLKQLWEAIDQTTTRDELVQALDAASGRHIERGMQAWRDVP